MNARVDSPSRSTYTTVMNKPLLVLTIGAALAMAAPLWAQDEGDAYSEQASTPTAAVLKKGYTTEVASPPPEAEPEDGPPVESHGAPLKPMPPLHPLSRRAAAAGGSAQTGATAPGLSCDKSDPPLTGGVIRETRPNLLRDTNKPIWYEVGPNQALSIKFTAQKSGMGGFGTEMATNARTEPHMVNVSETPCDFDLKKTFAGNDWGGIKRPGKPNPCYAFAAVGPGITIVPEGQTLAPGANTAAICFVKPGKTYYFNIRTFAPDPNRDMCAEDAKTMGPSLKCGGIWQFVGAELGSDKQK
jgi:hypothetical protein